MKQEAADKLVGCQCHGFDTVRRPAVPISESDLAVLEGQDAMIRQGYSMGVPPQVIEHCFGRGERFLGIDDPLLFSEQVEPMLEL
jgi:hypothetical protein